MHLHFYQVGIWFVVYPSACKVDTTSESAPSSPDDSPPDATSHHTFVQVGLFSCFHSLVLRTDCTTGFLFCCCFFFLFGRLETAVDDVCFFTASKDLDRRQVRIASWLGWLETCPVFFFWLVNPKSFFYPRALVRATASLRSCLWSFWALWGPALEAQSRAARRSP